MEQKVKEHLAETHAKTIFYITYGAVFFVCPVALFALSRLVMGGEWFHKYGSYVTIAGCSLGVVSAEIIARRVSKRAKK